MKPSNRNAPPHRKTLEWATVASLLFLGVSCSSVSPIQETGFHEVHPGTFDYFASQSQQCASIESSGSACSYAYDNSRRVTEIDCPGTVRVTISYDELNLVRTTRYEEYQGKDVPPVLVQSETDSFTLNGGFVESVVNRVEFASRPEEITTSTYTRDADHRLTQITVEGSIIGVQDFNYSQETGQLLSIASTYDEQGSDVRVVLKDRLLEFTWSGDQVATRQRTDADGNVWETTFSYDGEGRLEASTESADGITTTYSYGCDDS